MHRYFKKRISKIRAGQARLMEDGYQNPSPGLRPPSPIFGGGKFYKYIETLGRKAARANRIDEDGSEFCLKRRKHNLFIETAEMVQTESETNGQTELSLFEMAQKEQPVAQGIG